MMLISNLVLSICRACVIAMAVVLAAYASAADQPQWGQHLTRNMVSEEKGLPESFDPNTGRNVKWLVPLGTESYSTPIVANGKVLMGTNNQVPRDPRHVGDRGVLMCFNEADGKFCWQLVVPKITTSMFWDWPRSGICSTPTVEGDRVYAVSNRGEVMCLDMAGMANGNDGLFQDEAKHAVPTGSTPVEPGPGDADILWLFDIVHDCGVRQHDAAHASILLYGDYLYVNTSNGVDDTHKKIMAPDAPSLIVIDKRTGRLVARDDERIGPRIFHSTWSSPALGLVNGRPLVFFCGGDGIVYAFEPLTAAPPEGQVAKLKKVWSFDGDPTAPKENVHQFNSNRQVSPSNIKSMPVFCSGRLFVTMGGDLWWGKHQVWLKCIDTEHACEVWSAPLNRHCMSTPAVSDGLVFVGDCGRRVHCVDAATGKEYWSHDTRGDIWASPLVADGKVFIGTRQGEFIAFAANREKRLLATTELDSPICGSPIAANGVLYIATQNTLYAVKRSH